MNTDRQRDILKLLYENRSISVRKLAEALHVSEPAIRRDLALLEKQRLCKRFYGGAKIEANGVSDIKVPYMVREVTMGDEKQIIAQKAASFCKIQDLVFLDSSSSAAALLPYLAAFKDMTIVTNGSMTIAKAAEYPLRAICTGGILHRSVCAFYGEDALNTVNKYYANWCFISCSALDNLGNICDVNPEENQMRLAMIRQSNHTYLLCTSEKVGLRKFHRLCSIADIDGVIATVPPPRHLTEEMKLKWILVGQEAK